MWLYNAKILSNLLTSFTARLYPYTYRYAVNPRLSVVLSGAVIADYPQSQIVYSSSKIAHTKRLSKSVHQLSRSLHSHTYKYTIFARLILHIRLDRSVGRHIKSEKKIGYGQRITRWHRSLQTANSWCVLFFAERLPQDFSSEIFFFIYHFK